MAKSKKTQLLTLSLIATLISFIPFLSSSLRSTYLYFIINVLIVVLGVEAGVLSSSSSTNVKNNTNTNTSTNTRAIRVHMEEDTNEKREKPGVENSTPDNKIVVSANEVKKMIKKCPSTPSMFFIGGNESEKVEENVQENYGKEEEKDQDGVYYEEEELFEKAETFIVNFYKQLKMQREESWNKIHDFKDNGLLVN